MTLSLLVVLVASAAEPAPISVAAPGLSALDLTDAEAQFFHTHLAQALTAQGLTVMTPEQIASVIGVERQKQLLGCADESSCLTEIANALAADALLTGSLARLDNEYRYSLTVVSALNAAPMATASGKAKSKTAFADALTVAAAQLAQATAQKLGRPLTTAAATPPRESGRSKWGWLPLGAGMVATGAGSYFLLQANAKSNALTDPQTTLSHDDALRYAEEGPRQRNLGLGLAGAGVAAMGAGVVMLLLQDGSGESSPTVAVTGGPGGFAVGLHGVWR